MYRVPVLSVAVLAMAIAGTLGAEPLDEHKLAVRIDELLAAKWEHERIVPAPRADDAEFLRRVSLDITGRIPRSANVYEFLADETPDKRARLIDRLLAEPRYAIHFANVWRAELIPEVATNGQAAQLQRGFENWLVQKFRDNARFDQLVRELLTVPLPNNHQPAEPVLRDPERPNPLAFFAVKDSRPESIAAAVTRTFLGIRLECAQCHDHPSARWTQRQFWTQAAFFAGLEKRADGPLAPLTEAIERREIVPPDQHESIGAKFLVGGVPQWRSGQTPRVVFAEWLTSSENPYFARAIVNRLWGQFFGVGIVDPVDDFHDDNPASYPKLLDELATAFVESGFDLRFMIRALCLTDAYQRTSTSTHPSQDETRLPARMVVKALTGEQFYDSFRLATGERGGYRLEEGRGNSRQQFLSRFALAGPIAEPETSVPQALTLMNGRAVARATDPEQSPVLIAIHHMPYMTTPMKIEALYVAALSRPPSDQETQRLLQYIATSPPDREAERLADIFWILLNSVEFRVNH
jgi:hypothetical protein